MDGFASRAAWRRPGSPSRACAAARAARASPRPGGFGGAGGHRAADVAVGRGERAGGHGPGRAGVPGDARLATGSAGDLLLHTGRASELALRAAPAGGLAAQGHDGRWPRRRARLAAGGALGGRLRQGAGRHPCSRECSGSSRRSAASTGIPTTTRSRSSGRPARARPGDGGSRGTISRSISRSSRAGRSRSPPRSSARTRREVPSGPLKGLRVLSAEQDLGLALAREPRSGRGAPARHRGRVARRHRERPGTGRASERPPGCRSGVWAGSRATLVLRLLETYARNMRRRPRRERAPEDPRGRDRAASTSPGPGPMDAERPHYYRLHGPTLLIEYDNTQNNANHIHSVWHDPRSNFGADLLGAHYRTDRHHA